MSETSNDQIYELLCNVHRDIGEVKGAAAGFKQALESHIEDDKRTLRTLYDTQIVPWAAKVEELQLQQAKQKGVAKTCGLIATAAASIVGGAVGLIKWH